MYFYQHTNTSQESFIKIINKGTSLTIGSMCSSHVLFLEAGFTYDGVGVRLFIRSAEWYTPVKIINYGIGRKMFRHATCHSVIYDPRRVEF